MTEKVDKLAIEQKVDVKAIDDLKNSFFNITEQIAEQEKAIDDLTGSIEGKLMRNFWKLAKYHKNFPNYNSATPHNNTYFST